MNLAMMENLNLHCFVTWICVLSYSQPNGYGFGCGLVSNPNMLTISFESKFTYDPVSNNVSILMCLEMIHT